MSKTSTPISMRDFLTRTPPGEEKVVKDLAGRLWVHTSATGVTIRAAGGVSQTTTYYLAAPDIQIHCPECDGERTYGSMHGGFHEAKKGESFVFSHYVCRNCHGNYKRFALRVVFEAEPSTNVGSCDGTVEKIGEKPSFGAPLPRKLQKISGEEWPLLLKGRQAENQSLGLGAATYYRRAVENMRTRLIDELLRVVDAEGGDERLREELLAAKRNTQFARSVDQIPVPPSLLIDGRENPLKLIHAALSIDIHDGDDGDFLESATDVRRVLTRLAETFAVLVEERQELNEAARRLRAKIDERDRGTTGSGDA